MDTKITKKLNRDTADAMMRIGEVASLETVPFFHLLKRNYQQSFYSFMRADSHKLEKAMKMGELDLALASPATLAEDPYTYLILPDIGLGSRGPNGFSLLFSDMLLDDLDEMTISAPPSEKTATILFKVIVEKYLQYTNSFENNWAKSEAHILCGDSALRERKLNRYKYIYDLGELWRYYTEKPLIFSMWIVRADKVKQKRDMIKLFYRSLKYALEEAEENWESLAESVKEYNWIKKQDMIEFWERVDYRLEPEHYEGLKQFYQDAYELGLIENTPELDFLDVE